MVFRTLGKLVNFMFPVDFPLETCPRCGKVEDVCFCGHRAPQRQTGRVFWILCGILVFVVVIGDAIL